MVPNVANPIPPVAWAKPRDFTRSKRGHSAASVLAAPRRALTVDELTALSESGLVQSSSEDESMSYHDSSSDEDNIIALPLPSPSYSPTPSSDSEEAPQHEQREGDVEIEIEIEAVGTLACPSCIISQPGLTVQPRDGCYCGGGYCLRCGVDSCTCPWSSTVLSAHPLPHEEVRYPIAYMLFHTYP